MAGEKARWLRTFAALMEDPVLVPSSHMGEPVRVTSDSYHSITSEEDRVAFIHCFPSALGHNYTQRSGERLSLSELKTSERGRGSGKTSWLVTSGVTERVKNWKREKNLPPKGLGDLQWVLFPQPQLSLSARNLNR